MTVTPTDALGRTFDPVTYNAPAQNANISVTKTDSPDPVLAGQQLTYNLTVGNAGPRAATGSQLTDTLPGNVTFVSATPSQGTCSQTGVTVSCSLGTVANGANATVQIKVRPQATGTITQHGHRRLEPQRPEHRQQHRERGDHREPGCGPLDHEHRLARPGRGRARAHLHARRQQHRALERHHRERQRHPAGRGHLRLRHAFQGSCSQAAGTVSCSLGNVRNGGNGASRSRSRPRPRARSRTTASITSLTGDPNTANNSASAQTTVDPAANLSITKTDSPDPVLVGQQLTYTAHRQQRRALRSHRRIGQRHAARGVTFDSATPSQGTCSRLRHRHVRARHGGERRRRDRLDQGHAAGRRLDHQHATVSSAASTPARATTRRARRPLSTRSRTSRSRRRTSPTRSSRRQLTYTLTAQNAGPSGATGVVLTDTLPVGVVFVSATPSQGAARRRPAPSPAPSARSRTGAQLSRSRSGRRAPARSRTRPASRRASAIPTRPTTPPARDDRRPGRRPVAHQVRLARPGAGRPAAHLHAQRAQHRARRRHRHDAHGHAAERGHLRLRDPDPGQLLAGVRHCHCSLGTLASGANAGVEIKVTPQAAGSITNQASVSSSVSDPSSRTTRPAR